MTARLLFLVLVVGFLAAVPLRGKDNDHYRVQLIVSSPDIIRAETTSYLARELRRVGDIDVIEANPYFVISVLAVANANGGYTFSVVVLGTNKYLLSYFAGTTDHLEAILRLNIPGTNKYLLSHFLQVGATDDLEDMCKKIVAEIDGSVFEPMRRAPHYDAQGRLIE